jgi:hypothetical protein
MQGYLATPVPLGTQVISAPTLMLGHHPQQVAQYPLYEALAKAVEEQSVTVNAVSMGFTINQIAERGATDYSPVLESSVTAQEINASHYHNILTLCIHHAVIHQHYQPNPKQLPYGMRVMSSGKGVLIMITQLPGMLIQILTAYLEGKY